MRKFVSYAFVLTLLLLSATVFGQGYAFRVLANKGTNQVIREGASAAEALKTGATLNSGDEIVSTDGAYIGLMHKSGKTVEIRGAGTRKVSELEKTISTASSNIASRYASFVMNKLNEEENTNYRARLAATGAVSRATVSGKPIEIMLPSQVDVLGEVAIISWKKPAEGMEEGDLYVVRIKNIFDEVIYEAETDQTSVELDFTNEDMKNEAGLYLFSVAKKGSEEIISEEIGIKKVKPTDKREVQDNLATLKSEVPEDSPLNKLIYASFYEENGLLLDALTKYEEAISMSPEVEDFQELKQNFLLKNGLIAE